MNPAFCPSRANLHRLVLISVFALSLVAPPRANAQFRIGEFLTFGDGTRAHWLNNALPAFGATDTSAIELFVNVSSPSTFRDTAAVRFTGFSSSPPTLPPSFDFYSSAGGPSGGAPRMTIVFGDGSGELRPLAITAGTWTHQDGSTDWDSYGGSCGYRTTLSYAELLACHPGSAVIGVWVLNDGGWLHPGGYQVLIDSVSYGGELVFQQDVDVLNKPPEPTPIEDKVNAKPEGDVLVSLPPGTGTGAFVPLEQATTLPVGTVVDASSGSVALSSAPDLSGPVQSGRFFDGLFKIVAVTQTSTRPGLTDVRLEGQLPAACPKGSARAATLARRLWSDVRRRHHHRHLRASALGQQPGGFRVRAAHSTATAWSARWETIDRCDGTLTNVSRGRVFVRDPRHNRTIVVKAPHRYLASAR
jgi:hypothetical protein